MMRPIILSSQFVCNMFRYVKKRHRRFLEPSHHAKAPACAPAQASEPRPDDSVHIVGKYPLLSDT